MGLVHYIFVRRDLPLGVIAAMVTHAAGESAPFYQDETGRFRGATAVVLETQHEGHLGLIAGFLEHEGLQHVQIRESSGLYANQLMAIGLVPRERDEHIKELLGKFQLLKTCLDNPSNDSISSENSNATEKETYASQDATNMGLQSLLG